MALVADNAFDSYCSFLWQCYKDLGQRENARKMVQAACSMNAVSKEVGTYAVLSQRLKILAVLFNHPCPNPAVIIVKIAG